MLQPRAVTKDGDIGPIAGILLSAIAPVAEADTEEAVRVSEQPGQTAPATAADLEVILLPDSPEHKFSAGLSYATDRWDEGFGASEATVGRILRHLMDHGVILRLRTHRKAFRRARRMRRHYAQRLPKTSLRPTKPGERSNTPRRRITTGEDTPRRSEGCQQQRALDLR